MAGILINVPLQWRTEINAIAAARRTTVNGMLREILARELGLGGQPARARETITQKLAREWRFPGDPRLTPGAEAARALGGRRRARGTEEERTGVPHSDWSPTGAPPRASGPTAAGPA